MREFTGFPPTIRLHDKEGKTSGEYLVGDLRRVTKYNNAGKDKYIFTFVVRETNVAQAWTGSGDDAKAVPVELGRTYALFAPANLEGRMREVIEEPEAYRDWRFTVMHTGSVKLDKGPGKGKMSAQFKVSGEPPVRQPTGFGEDE